MLQPMRQGLRFLDLTIMWLVFDDEREREIKFVRELAGIFSEEKKNFPFSDEITKRSKRVRWDKAKSKLLQILAPLPID